MITKFKLYKESFFYPFNKHKRGGPNYSHEELVDEDFSQEPENLEDEIKFAIKWYPTLHYGQEARERALTSIYLAIGGDYDWDKHGQRTHKFEGFENDSGMLKNKKDQYNSHHRIKERDKEIESIKKDLEYYKYELEEYTKKSDKTSKTNDYITYLQTKVDRDENELKELEEHNNNFNPHYHRFKSEDEPIDKIPWGINFNHIEGIPDNIQKDYLDGLYEIISFYSQKRFKKDGNYPTLVKIKKMMKDKYKDL